MVKVETSLGLDASQVARQVQGVLDDERSCVGSTANSFRLVTDEEQADMCSTWPPRTPRSPCAGRCVRRTWSCNTGARVVLNADRWRWMTPTYTDRVQYRAYLVNHEVGHSLRLGHVGCPGPGRPAPVMMQQSKSLGGCQINPWPAAYGWR